MAKPLKIALAIVGSLILLLVGAAIALPLLFDPNQFRTQIADAVHKATGRHFEVGTISLHVFPWLRITVTDTQLGNAAGFGDTPFATAKSLDVGVRLLPLLFDRQIQARTITLDGLRLNLAIDGQGTSNWQDLIERQTPSKDAAPPSGQTDQPGFALDRIDIGGIEIRDAAIRYHDARSGKVYRLEPLTLKTGTIKPGRPFVVDLAVTALSEAPKAVLDLTLRSSVTPDLDAQRITLDTTRLGFKAQLNDQGLDAHGELDANILADLATRLFTVENLKVQAEASGKAVPGGKQTAKLSGTLRFDQKNGQLAFEKGRIETAGLALTTAIQGRLTGKNLQFSGPISIASFSPRELFAQLGVQLQTADPKALSKATLKTHLSGDSRSVTLSEFAFTLDDTSIDGRIAVTDFATQALEFALKADSLDADRYLPPQREPSAAKQTGDSAPSDINQIKLPTQALDALNANGTLTIASLKINGLKLSDVRLQLSGHGKTAKTQNLSARLYGGSINLGNRYIPGTTPNYALQTRIDALSAAPFLKDLLGKDYVSGLANLALDLNSRGTTVGDLRRALNGSVSVRVENGAIKGFNLGQILRQGQALLAGEAAPNATEPLETDFATLTASAKIIDGVLKTDDLSAASPAFRLVGSGQIDLVNETIRFLAKPTVVETSKGQGGKGLDQLKGLTIPIEISGNLFSPRYKLDLENALKERAKEKVQQKLAEELGLPKGETAEQQLKQKAAEKLGELLFGRKRKQEEPAPAASAPEPTPP